MCEAVGGESVKHCVYSYESVCFVLGFLVEGILALRAAAGFSFGSTPQGTRRRSYRSVFAIILC